MTFNDFCKQSGKTNAIIGKELGVTGEYIGMLRKGIRLPGAALQIEIYNYTKHLVMPNDWLPDHSPNPNLSSPETEEAA